MRMWMLLLILNAQGKKKRSDPALENRYAKLEVSYSAE